MPNIHSYDKHFMPKVAVAIASQASANTPWEAPFIDSGYGDRWFAEVVWGAVGTSIVAKLTQAQDSSGTGAKDITGAAFTLTASANKLATLEIGPGALDDANGFKYVRCEVTVVGTVLWGVNTVRYNIRNVGHFRVTQDSSYYAQVRVYD